MTERVLETHDLPPGASHDLTLKVAVPNGTVALRLVLVGDGAISDVEMRIARCGAMRDSGTHAGSVELATPWCNGPFGREEEVRFSGTGAMAGQLTVHARRLS